ncbi:MAG TPA: glycosyltransferase family 39 protein [Alphaproteobacteria bacterium]|nr:glycosyltransferase family 39 protein [Alphaproteobacteria bacterium]
MLSILREFKVGRPQVIAGLLLLAFFSQCLWVGGSRKLSDLEYQYIAAGLPQKPGLELGVTSPLTGWVAALPLKVTSAVRKFAPAAVKAALAIPQPWFLRLPFMIFGFWLGAALWWVARRLFGDPGGYIALALYCFSPAMVQISSNIGPEIILAWGSFGLIYTSIGVAHTVYSPPRKWLPRIGVLGLSIGFCISTVLWSATLLPLAAGYMLYLAPNRRRPVLVILGSALLLGGAILACVAWLTGSIGLPSLAYITPVLSKDILYALGFAIVDGLTLAVLMVMASTAYGSWQRARYFGNTAPLVTSFFSVVIFALVPAIYLWKLPLGLSFTFVYIGGVAADLLETPYRRLFLWFAGLAGCIRVGEDFVRLAAWIHQNAL